MRYSLVRDDALWSINTTSSSIFPLMSFGGIVSLMATLSPVVLPPWACSTPLHTAGCCFESIWCVKLVSLIMLKKKTSVIGFFMSCCSLDCNLCTAALTSLTPPRHRHKQFGGKTLIISLKIKEYYEYWIWKWSRLTKKENKVGTKGMIKN